MDRRNFLRRSSAMLGGVPGFLTLQALLNQEALGQAPAKNRPAFNPRVFDFWSKSVRAPYDDFQSGLSIRGGTQAAPEDAAFLYYSPSDGFQLASALKRDKLPDKGNVDVLVRVQRFRPSDADRAKFANLETGSLRIDVKQVDKLPGVPEALAWTAMATLLSNRRGIPAFEKLDFNPGTAWGQFDKVPLPSGMGFWSWNFFLKRKEGAWGRLLTFFHKTQQYLPFLGLPAIAVTALKAVDNLLGYLQAEGESSWLFKSVDSPVVATKESFDRAPDSTVLIPGTYIALRQSQISKLQKLEVKQGLLVQPGTKDLEIFDSAAVTLKDVTYVSMTVNPTASKST